MSEVISFTGYKKELEVKERERKIQAFIKEYGIVKLKQVSRYEMYGRKGKLELVSD